MNPPFKHLQQFLIFSPHNLLFANSPNRYGETKKNSSPIVPNFTQKIRSCGPTRILPRETMRGGATTRGEPVRIFTHKRGQLVNCQEMEKQDEELLDSVFFFFSKKQKWGSEERLRTVGDALTILTIIYVYTEMRF